MSATPPPRRALVTGAARGIGLAVARALKEKGHAVFGTARSPERLGGNVEGIPLLPLDLRDEGSIRECARRVGDIDILVNNAGQSRIGPAEDIPPEEFAEDFTVNVFGAVSLIRAFLPRMREKGGGFVINIGSLAAEFPVPFQSSYSASKSALAAFTRSLRSEVGRYGIKVVLVEPYHILTPIEPRMSIAPASPYREDAARMKATRDRKMAGAAPPEIVARAVLKILNKKNPAPRYAVGGPAPVMVFLKRFLPDRTAAELTRRGFGLQKPGDKRH